MGERDRSTKIKFYGLEELVMQKLFRDGKASRIIVEEILLEKGIKLHYTTVEIFRKNMMKHARDYFKDDEEYSKRIADMQINSMELMYDTLLEIQEKIEQFRDNPKAWQAHSKYLDQALKMLFLVLKKNKEIGPEIQVNKMNVMNITNAFKDRVVEVVDYAILHGGSVEMFPPEVQEMYKKSKGMYAYA